MVYFLAQSHEKDWDTRAVRNLLCAAASPRRTSMLTRRDFSKSVLAGATASLASGNLLRVGKQEVPPDQSSNQACDLLIKGGTVIDPGQHLHALMDVAVNDGKIIEVSKDFPESRARQVFSAKDKIVTPGLIDIHVHCFDGVGLSINADHYCLGRGTTTVVDAGSTGYFTIGRFVKDVVSNSITRIHPLVHIGAVGAGSGLPRPMDNLAWEDPLLTAKAAEYNKPAVVGIKVHLAQNNSSRPKDLELEFVKRGLEAAEATKLPMMVHINETYYPLSDILKFLRKGDIFTHCFSGFPQDSPLDANGKILPVVREARDRGVIFDIGEGPAHRHFSFDVAEKCLQQGFLPDTISSDLSDAHYLIGDLTTSVSKFLALGMDIDKAIELVTLRPSQVFDFGAQIGTLRPGSEADISVFELQQGKFEYVSGGGGKREGTQKLVNKAVVRRGRLFVNAL
jgi:dihydroorotase